MSEKQNAPDADRVRLALLLQRVDNDQIPNGYADCIPDNVPGADDISDWSLYLADRVLAAVSAAPDADREAIARMSYERNPARRKSLFDGSEDSVSWDEATDLEKSGDYAFADAILALRAPAQHDHTAAKASLLVLCAIRDAQSWHENMLKDIDFAIEANRTAIATPPAQHSGADYFKPHKLMTRKEYNAVTLKGLHCVEHNYDGGGNTAVWYCATLPPSMGGERIAALEATLREHHNWHLQSGPIGLQDGSGGWIEIDNAAEYSDSAMYERTEKLLAGAPPAELQPMPRGGMNIWWWEQAVKLRRELRKLKATPMPRGQEGAEFSIEFRNELADFIRDYAVKKFPGGFDYPPAQLAQCKMFASIEVALRAPSKNQIHDGSLESGASPERG